MCSVFNLVSKEGTCFAWHEGEGGLSANEFCSIICKFVQDLDVGENDEVILWSDGCTYQNRNVILGNGLLAVAQKKNITIYQKYLSRGHTQMDCDSMHTTIERRLKNFNINVPADYVSVFNTDRLEFTSTISSKLHQSHFPQELFAPKLNIFFSQTWYQSWGSN